ncbi:MAG: RNA polymerase sigma factor [Cuneatibacter sp.]|nr:RNA polymerase sigma factor [Cuneatibacter sp.]
MQLDYVYLASLVHRVQSNDSSAFAELYSLTYQKEYQFACSFLKDRELAQDALQETYIRAYKNIDRLQEAKVFIPWLHAINFRVCSTMLTKKKKSLEEFQDETIWMNLIDGAPEANPEIVAVKHSEEEDLFSGLDLLPEKEKQAINLRYLKQMPLAEVAASMDCSLSTAKRYILNGKNMLRKHLERGGSWSCKTPNHRFPN